ncbi:hypothetical protein [Vibrio sonorensis]|uniref:hypothetical protein n=1 Tax=Vibrio sonorensis TaxID=1004316 RepID=UPI0008DA5268|nr:hypothetical protein [Vibrio sonorensis]
MKYKVIKAYTDAPEVPIQISVGEKLQFVKDSESDGPWANWIYCKGVDKEGWVPKQILQFGESELTVTQDYIATEHSLTEGEVLVKKRELNGWIWAEKETELGQFAWAPLNHLIQLD